MRQKVTGIPKRTGGFLVKSEIVVTLVSTDSDPETITARPAAVPGWRKTRRRDGRGRRSRISSSAGAAATRKGINRMTHAQKE
jgi:hypothetical protein